MRDINSVKDTLFWTAELIFFISNHHRRMQPTDAQLKADNTNREGMSFPL